MLRKNNQSATSTTETADDDSDEDANGLSYGLEEYGQRDTEASEYDEDEEYEDDEGEEYEEDEEYEDDEGEEYDEDEEYKDEDDEDADSGEAGDEGDDEDEFDDEYDEEDDYDEEEKEDEEVFTPPSAAAALKRSWLSSRLKAQPATGTEEDAKKVNFIDRREGFIGYFLGIMLMALAVASYFVDRHYVDKSNLKLQADIHREAPWILVITLGLGLMILLATYFKRRAAVGFTLLLAGVALFNSDFLIGVIYLGTGLWLVFRSMKRSPRNAAARAGRSSPPATARSSVRGRASATPTPARSTSRSTSTSTSTRSTTTTTTTRSTPGRTIGRNRRLASSSGPTGRYTPPKPVRHVPPGPQSEPEPTNRLSAWLKK